MLLYHSNNTVVSCQTIWVTISVIKEKRGVKRGIENDIALFLYFILSWLVSMSAADFVINECYKTTTTAVATRRTAKDRQHSQSQLNFFKLILFISQQIIVNTIRG